MARTFPTRDPNCWTFTGSVSISQPPVLANDFGKDVAAVGTNVARFLSLAFGRGAAANPSTAENWKLADWLAPAGRCGDYLHALIDFGAAVCPATDPYCESCLLEYLCEYRTEEGR